MKFRINSLIISYLVFVFFCAFFCSGQAYQPHQHGVASWNSFPHQHTVKKISDPKFVMADVVNNLGLKLLAVSIQNLIMYFFTNNWNMQKGIRI